MQEKIPTQMKKKKKKEKGKKGDWLVFNTWKLDQQLTILIFSIRNIFKNMI